MSDTAQTSRPAIVNGQAPAPTVSTDTDVRITNDATSHDTTQIHNDQVTYDKTTSNGTSVHGEWPADADAHVRDLIAQAEADRQQIENTRANHRNHNRLYTLIFTLVAGLIITFGLYHRWFGAWGPGVGPYSFVITVAGDTILTSYALYKHY